MSKKSEKSLPEPNPPENGTPPTNEPEKNNERKTGGAFPIWLLLVVALVVVCLALLAKKAFDSLDNLERANRHAENPLFADDAEDPGDGIPEGALSALADAEKIEREIPEHQAEFEKALRNATDARKKELKARDALAAERLEILKKLENSKNSEERAEIIKTTLEKHR